MNLKADKEIKEALETIKRLMMEYMEGEDVDYIQKDVDKCLEILDAYLEEMMSSKGKEAGLSTVKNTVLQLNYLNDSCEGELIETMEREEICAVIIRASELMGYSSDDDDVTEEWREW